MSKLRSVELEVTSVGQLLEMVGRYGETYDLLFRGQSSQFPKLTTTLERHHRTSEDFERSGLVPSMGEVVPEGRQLDAQYSGLPSREAQNLKVFQTRARHFLTDLPAIDNYCEWFALMQHHGSPTRLLDVTKSIFVALYFATAHSSEHDGIIYSFYSPDVVEMGDPDVLRNTDLSDIRIEFEHIRDYPARQSAIANGVIAFDGSLFGPGFAKKSNRKKRASGIIEFVSQRPSRREIAQQGRFIVPISMLKPLEEHLATFYSSRWQDARSPTWEIEASDASELSCNDHQRSPVLKLRIPRAKFREVKLALKHMNITGESLFPDFAGLANAINHETIWGKEVYGR